MAADQHRQQQDQQRREQLIRDWQNLYQCSGVMRPRGQFVPQRGSHVHPQADRVSLCSQ